MSSLSLPQCCCLTCFNTVVLCVILSVLTLKKTSIPLSALVLGLAFMAACGTSKEEQPSRAHPHSEIGQWGMLGESCQKQSRYEMILLSPHSYLGPGNLWRKNEVFEAPWWVLVGVSLSQCFPKNVTVMPVQPLFTERKGAEGHSRRDCFIFWLMSESFIITALIRVITATLVNKMCLRLLSESNTHLLTTPR